MTMGWQERIIINPAILAGKPVIKGTRLSVEFIIDLMAQGWSESEILGNYPGLKHDDIQACLSYVGEMLRSERVYPLKISQEGLRCGFWLMRIYPLAAIARITRMRLRRPMVT